MRAHPAFTRAVATLAIAVVQAGCPAPSLPPAGEDERRAFLASLADDVVLPRLQRLEVQAGDLVDATAALAATNGNDAAARASARDALATLQATWQQLEVMHAGPAGAPTTFTGGKGLREGIHSWPQVSPCSVDQQVVQNRMNDPGWATTRLVNVLGLHTLEYLLFRTDNANACPEAASINADGTWAALGDAEVTARRALYARVVAQDVLAKVQTLRAAWMGGFADTLKSAGDDGSLFPTAQQALDEVYAALFFAELKTKDRKLAVPAGLHVDCAAEVCPELTESPFSRLSLQHIEHNLRGARLVVVGNDGTSNDGTSNDGTSNDGTSNDSTNGAGTDGAGFDDLLVFAGHDEAAADIVQKLDAALLSTTSFSGSLEDALVSEPERVRALHATVKVFTDELKATLPSLLGLRVPDEGAGDND